MCSLIKTKYGDNRYLISNLLLSIFVNFFTGHLCDSSRPQGKCCSAVDAINRRPYKRMARGSRGVIHHARRENAVPQRTRLIASLLTVSVLVRPCIVHSALAVGLAEFEALADFDFGGGAQAVEAAELLEAEAVARGKLA